MNRPLALAALATAVVLAHPPRAIASSNSFTETDLVSDLPGRAAHLDANLVNPWGIVLLPNGRLRVADNGVGMSTVYGLDGTALKPTITVPPSGSGNPTGIAVNNTLSDFMVSNGTKSGRSRFLFASEDGTISAWSPDVDSLNAITVVTTPDGVYKGLAIGRGANGNRLYAANFHAGTIDVFDGHFAPVSLPAGAFTDPDLAAGYGPFNIANLLGRLYVSYAKQDADKHDDEPGAGFGFVDVYDFQGQLLHRLITQGELDAPWGMAIAPSGFGGFGGALLVGNFGNGWINAFNPMTGDSLGSLRDSTGAAIAIDGLWGLAFAGVSREDGGSEDDRAGLKTASGDDGDSQGDDNDQGDDDQGNHHGGGPTLFFTAGIQGEDHGLLGTLRAPRTRGDDDADEDKGDHDDRALRVTMAHGNPAHLSDRAVQFTVSTEAPTVVRLRVYDVRGRLVAEPMSEVTVNGSVVANWNVSDKHGERIRAGSYLYRAVGGQHIAQGHLVVLP